MPLKKSKTMIPLRVCCSLAGLQGGLAAQSSEPFCHHKSTTFFTCVRSHHKRAQLSPSVCEPQAAQAHANHHFSANRLSEVRPIAGAGNQLPTRQKLKREDAELKAVNFLSSKDLQSLPGWAALVPAATLPG